MARIFRHAMGQLTETLGPIVEVYRQRGHIPDDVPVEDVVGVILAQAQGFILQMSLLDVRPETYLRGLDALLGAFEATGRPAAFAGFTPSEPAAPAMPSAQAAPSAQEAPSGVESTA